MNDLIQKINNDELIGEIKTQALEYVDAEIYLVGGCIRDFYLDVQNFDKDIVIDKICAEEFAKSLAQKLDATFIVLDEDNKIYRLVLKIYEKIHYIDIANVIGENIEQDLKRRDLTINAIAYNLKKDEFLDVTGGIEDLKNKYIKGISEQNFIEDPLRLLRIYRFYSNLADFGFNLDENLSKIAKSHAKKIKLVAQERINYELIKLFGCAKDCFGGRSMQSSGHTSRNDDLSFGTDLALKKMDEAGLLEEILPIISSTKKVPPNSHHHLNLFDHSIETVRQVQLMYNQSPDEVKKHLDKIEFGAETRLAHLKIAALLHDIGKFETWTIEQDTGKHRFIKHDDLGAKMVAKFLKLHKYSKKQVEYISKMVKYHIYPSHVVQSPELQDRAEKIYMRMIRKMGDDLIDVITLAKADRYSAQGVEITKKIVDNNIDGLNKLLDFYLKVKDELKPLPKLLSGEEIMEVLNIKPSKELGEIIKSLKEAQISDDINTKEEALDFIKTLK